MATTKKSASSTKKRTTVKKSVVKTPVEPSVRSLRRSVDDTPFFTVRFSHQTVYWLILAALVIGLAAWVLQLSIKIQDIYNQIDIVETSDSSMTLPKPTVKKQ